MKRILPLGIAGLALLLASSATAQDTDEPVDSIGVWKKNLDFDLTATQTSYSDSWVGGEAGSFSWQSNLLGNAERRFSPKFRLRSELKLKFGQTLSQDAETKDWRRPQKSTDLIDWENVGTFTLDMFVDPYVAFRLESQFYDGRVREKKLWFSPLLLTESVGGSHRFYEKNDDHLTSRAGLALRELFRRAVDTASPNLDVLDSTFVDAGLESVTDAVLSVHKNIRYVGKLTLFKAVFFSEKDKFEGTPREDDWKAVDVNWENTLDVTVSKYVTVKLYAQVLYDKEIVDKGRFKQTLALGVTYKLW
jgi:hypothetical protein